MRGDVTGRWTSQRRSRSSCRRAGSGDRPEAARPRAPLSTASNRARERRHRRRLENKYGKSNQTSDEGRLRMLVSPRPRSAPPLPSVDVPSPDGAQSGAQFGTVRPVGCRCSRVAEQDCSNPRLPAERQHPELLIAGLLVRVQSEEQYPWSGTCVDHFSRSKHDFGMTFAARAIRGEPMSSPGTSPPVWHRSRAPAASTMRTTLPRPPPVRRRHPQSNRVL